MDPQTMKTDLLSEPENLNTSHTSRAIVHLTESEHTVHILHKYTQSNDSAGGRMRKRWTVFAVVAVALLLVCIHAFHKPEANAKTEAKAVLAAAEASAAAEARAVAEAKAAAKAKAAEANAAAAAQDKAAAEDKAALESQQRVIQAVGGTACGVVASGIGYGVLYGLYWMVTQGD